MANGFLGYDASFMLDVVVCALVLVVPTLLASIYLVKFRRQYTWHRNIQVTLAVVLLIAVTAFEVDLQFIHNGWESIVNKNPESPRLNSDQLASVRTILRVHLLFAISTPVFWAITLVLALKRFPSPPAPNAHSTTHKRLGWISAIDLALTSITGLIFYYVAFVSPPA